MNAVTTLNLNRQLPAPPAAAAGGGPPWRALVALLVVVLAAHTLVLQTKPGRFGPEPGRDASRTEVFQTRRIEAPPPDMAAPQPVAAPPSASRPRLKKKAAQTHTERAQTAINLIANPAPEAPATDEPAALAPADSAAEPATASAAQPAASAPVAPAAATAAGGAEPAPSAVTAMTLPASARLEYQVTGFSKGLTYHASGELVWANAGSRYDARMTVSALFIGSRSLSSSGQISAEGLAPRRFADKGKTEVAAHFEPDKGQVIFSANTPSAPWIKGVQDRVSVFMQLGGMLAGNPAALPPGSLITLYTVGPRDADSWTFRVEAEETLVLPLGEMRAVKLTRQPRREFDQKVEIWYAPALGYLPVRSKITQHGGDFVDQQLSAVGKS